MAALDRETAGRSTDIARPLEQIAESVRKRGLVILISDLLAPSEGLRSKLGSLRSRGHDVVVLRVLDPAELEFTFSAPGMFEDVETGRQLYIDPGAARAEYQRRFAEHSAALKRTCLDLGIEFTQVAIDQPLELALFDLLQSRLQRARRRVRRVAPRRRRAAI
jgi:uncharacterized protein (DUF58 family)